MSDQPREITADQSIDEITVFLGNIEPIEHELRFRIRTFRNAASWKAHNTDSRSARALAQMVAETGTAWVYAPATVQELTEVATYLRRLLICADQAEALEASC